MILYYARLCYLILYYIMLYYTIRTYGLMLGLKSTLPDPPVAKGLGKLITSKGLQ